MNSNNINKKIVFKSKQTKKIYSNFIRKILSLFHIQTTPHTNTNNLQLPINNFLLSNILPIHLPSLHLQFSQSTAQQKTDLDNNIQITKIIIDIPADTTQVSRTPKICSISKNNNNTSLPTYKILYPGQLT